MRWMVFFTSVNIEGTDDGMAGDRAVVWGVVVIRLGSVDGGAGHPRARSDRPDVSVLYFMPGEGCLRRDPQVSASCLAAACPGQSYLADTAPESRVKICAGR